MIRSLLALLFLLPATRPATTPNPTAFPDQVGQINYFGYAGLDLAAIQNGLPVHPGDRFQEREFAAMRNLLRSFVQNTTGRPLTDLDIVCCDKNNHLLLFLGLSGTSSRPFTTLSAPTGTDHLEPAAIKLLDQESAASLEAITHGDAGEDDSSGYALTKFPAAHKIQLAMRTYAVHRESEITRVLRNSANPKQRRAAAMLLGYALRSSTQIASLALAARDPDFEVRNNAVRALEVLAAASNAEAIDIPLDPFIDLLFSGHWTDRNKASFLLLRLTEHRDPAVLAQLKDRALQPLIEGASWGSPGHAYAFLKILGRIEGLSESKIDDLIDQRKQAQIIAAAA